MSSSTLILNVTPEEFLESLRPIIREELSQIQPRESKSNYFSRKEAAERLHISLPTLHEYTRKGIIQGSRIGGRVLYTEQAILDAVKAIPTLRYSGIK